MFSLLSLQWICDNSCIRVYLCTVTICPNSLSLLWHYNDIKITKQFYDVIYVKNVRIMDWSGPHWSRHILSEYEELFCKSPFSFQIREKNRTKKKFRTRMFSTQWSGFAVHHLKFAFVSTLRDKLIFLV